MSPTTTKSIAAKVLIVDDHPAVRESLAMRIGQHPNMDVCGEAADINEALRLVTETDPDLAVVDISLKSGNGIDLVKRIKNHNTHVRMLVWSMHSESLYAERALRAGALGYVNKDQPTEKILDALERILEGKVYLSEAMIEKLLRRGIGGEPKDFSRSPLDVLADRELEVFHLIGEGLTTTEIAERLHLSVKTIETYRDRIRHKLDLANSVKLAHYAAQWTIDTK